MIATIDNNWGLVPNLNVRPSLDPSIRHSKIKIVASIKKDYTRDYLQKLVDEGVRIMRIDGSIFNHKEYTVLIEQINFIFDKIDEIPTIIYDLKGPNPTITKIGTVMKKHRSKGFYTTPNNNYYQNADKSDPCLSLKKGQIVKFAYEYHHTSITDDEEEVIYLDKKIAEILNIGDTLVIDGTNVKVHLKVIGFEKSNRLRAYKKSNFRKFSSNLEENLKVNNLCPHKNYLRNRSQSGLIPSHIVNHNNEDYEKILRMFYPEEDDYDYLFPDADSDNIISKVNEGKKIRDRIRNSTYPHKANSSIVCEVLNDGNICCQSKINLADRNLVSELDLSIIGAKDITDISKIVNLGINFITTVVYSGHHIDEIMDLLNDEVKENFKFLARVETHDALANFDEILQKCDGIIITRGSNIENFVVEKCQTYGKILLLQTHLNFSENVFLDFATIDFAVRKGFDGLIIKENIMTSALNKENPFIKSLKETIIKYESNSAESDNSLVQNLSYSNFFNCLFENVTRASHELKAKLIILYTDDYQKVKIFSKFRPYSLIIYPVNKELEIQMSNLISGILPLYLKEIDEENVNKTIIDKVKSRMDISASDKIIIVHAYGNLDKMNNGNLCSKNGMYIV